MLRRSLIQAAALCGALPLPAIAQESGDIVVAQIGPFTVLPAPDPKELNEGLVAAFDELNGKGGINGRKVQLLKLDDTYSFDGFKARLDEVMARKPVALLAPLGSATLKGLLESKLLDSTDITILNAVPGAGVLRDPGHPKFFHIRAGDAQQIQKIVSHARALSIKSMGVMYQDLPIGSSGLASAKAAASADGGGLQIVEAKAGTDPAAIQQAAKALATAAPQSALVVGAPKFVADSIAALRAAGVSQMIFTLSYLPGSALLKAAGPGARGVGIAQTYPNPAGVSLPLQRAFRAAMQAKHPGIAAPTSFHMEGYVTARVFAEAARRAKPLTPGGLAESLRRMGEVDLGGFRVNFSKGNVGSSWVDIAVVNAEGKLVY
ncbi:ABC transporter substrate-binding protein [Hydrogenophaga sp. RWCD_12]|uniref:ABC transporter substrate-binding protein n=1 Tax=Hydrogenophaga sp. RWCD_12 TaxID=3391190 RepID=UPI003984E02D